MRSFQGYTVRTLFDPVQTHAVYGVHPNNVAKIKSALKDQVNATRFRIVTSGLGSKIICFKMLDQRKLNNSN